MQSLSRKVQNVATKTLVAVRNASHQAGPAFCLDLVKKRDREHFLTTLLLPAPIRSLGFALRAFNIEVTSVRDNVRDTHTGLIRMQFWKDAVEAMDTDRPIPGHPVLQELFRHRSRLDKNLLLNLIRSKEAFFQDEPFKTVADVENYAKDSFSSLNLVLLTALSQAKNQTDISGHARHCAHQLGLAEGLATLLRGTPYNASKKRIYIPSDLLLSHKIPQQSIIRGSNDPKVCHVFEALAARADEHLTNCRFRAKYLERDEKLLLLPAVLVDSYLNRLHKADCNVFDAALQKADSLLALRLYFKKMTRSF